MKTITAGMTGALFLSALNNDERFYNVKDYGAYGDNSHDDTVAIQDAINACATAGGGTVYFPNGIYIIGGALQTSVGGLNPNSQLYIPQQPYTSASRIQINLKGESFIHYANYPFTNGTPVINTGGVILKSTIAGSGTMPSVIGTIGASGLWGKLNYNYISFENISVIVDANEGATGPTMTAINMYYADHISVNKVYCGIDVPMVDSCLPQNHTYGLIACPFNGTLGSMIRDYWCEGYWCGLATGEGSMLGFTACWGCYIGYMALASVYAIHILNMACHACCYPLSAQVDTIDGAAPGTSRLIIDFMAIEPRPTAGGAYWADWMAQEDIINDASNYLYGYFKTDIKSPGGSQGQNVTRSTGGNNLLHYNTHVLGTMPEWVTLDRPTVPTTGTGGFNRTTGKAEVWDGSAWQNCW